VRVVEVVEARDRGQEEVPEAEPARLGLQLLDYRRQRVVTAADGGALLGVDALGRVDAALEEVIEARGEVEAARRERQVHTAKLPSACSKRDRLRRTGWRRLPTASWS
jgi:hypothetical protein